MDMYEIDYGTHSILRRFKSRGHADGWLSDEGQRPLAVRLIPLELSHAMESDCRFQRELCSHEYVPCVHCGQIS